MPLKVLISSVQFQGENAGLRQLQAALAARLSPLGDFDQYGRLCLAIEPGREIKIPKDEFSVLSPMAEAA